jgi:hypothetical protein
MNTWPYWFELAVVLGIFAVGNILFGHFEAGRPKWRRVLKVAWVSAIMVGVSAWAGRSWFFGLLALMSLVVLLIHGWWLPFRHGINGWTAEPREKYYALRGWKWPPDAAG